MAESHMKKTLFSPETRLIFLALLSITALLIENIPTLAALYLLALTSLPAARPTRSNVTLLIAVSLAAVWGFIATQAFFYPYHPRTAILTLITPDTPVLGPLTGGIAVYMEGFVYGLSQSLRFLIMITAGLSVVWQFSPHQLLNGMRRLKLPYGVAFMLSAAIRFLPAIARDTKIVISAMRMRGFPLSPAQPWNYLRAVTRSLMPVLHRNIRRASMLADSVESRGFALREKSGINKETRTSHIERIARSAGTAIVAVLVVIKVLVIIASKNIFYIEQLRPLYAFAELYL